MVARKRKTPMSFALDELKLLEEALTYYGAHNPDRGASALLKRVSALRRVAEALEPTGGDDAQT